MHWTTTDGRRPEPTASPPRWTHRPAFDGVRVVAVYLVVAYHGGLDVFEGGFVGVDLFFVLSGFLVTSMLLQEQTDRGGIRLVRFYSRRILRLLPASALAIVGTAAAFVLVAPVAERQAVMGGARSAFLYVANWYFLGQSNDYFASEEAASPFLHFWSLSIEEQYYLVFPVVLIGLVALARRCPPHVARRSTVLVTGLGALCALSLASQLVAARTDQLRAYYATDARLYQILAGATLAAALWFWPSILARWTHPAIVVGALGALVVVASSSWSPSPSTRGLAATVASLVAVAALEAQRDGPAGRALGTETVGYLGRISYGTYLWHWPVIVIAARVVELSPIAATVLGAVVGTALGALSHQLVELPIRRWARPAAAPRAVIVVGLASSLIGAFVVVPAILGSERPMALAAGAPVVMRSDGPVPDDVAWEAAQADTPVEPVCLEAPATDCVVVQGEGLHLHLVGDSHAKTVLPLFEQLAEDRGYTFSATVTGGCLWQRDLLYIDNEERTRRCSAMQPDWYDRVIPELDPDVVILFHRALEDPVFPRKVTASRAELAGLGQNEMIERASEATIDELRDDGRRVVVMEPLPLTRGTSPTACLSSARRLSECAFTVDPGPLPSEVVYRRADDRSDDVWSVDLDPMVCPDLPTCSPMVDGLVVRRDTHHLTGTFARHLSDQVADRLDRAGALAPP